MKIAIVGSRSFNDFEKFEELLNANLKIDDVELIVSGGAPGADTLARKFAIKNNIKIQEFIPNWKLYGRAAGFIRNELIIKNCDKAFAFWDGHSHGTKHDIVLCERMKKEIKIFRI